VRRLVAVVLAATLVAALLYRAVLAQAAHECEACVRFRGAETCRRAAAATREEAERAAAATACAVLVSGVTATLECQAVAPLRLDCRAR
jgi:hypothetical protein